MIEAIDLTKIYNRGKKNQVEAVTDACVKAEDGEITALVGPSGCGKTTLMSMIGQLLTPTKGKVLVNNEDITAYSDGWKAIFRRKNVGFVFQHINLLPNLNALENVMTPLLCHDIDPTSYKQPALNLLKQLGLTDRTFFEVEQLSGGQQQRVAVARALITEPKIIIADEPLTFVDEASAKTITDFFEELKKEGKTILISTHAANLAKLADKTYEMRNGRMA
ncbi:MAG: putative transport system ATP-binding protein [Thermoproteota archaeon]|nr:putative transport system ATP-binding protein [Thermoproteota archaeon]